MGRVMAGIFQFGFLRSGIWRGRARLKLVTFSDNLGAFSGGRRDFETRNCAPSGWMQPALPEPVHSSAQRCLNTAAAAKGKHRHSQATQRPDIPPENRPTASSHPADPPAVLRISAISLFRLEPSLLPLRLPRSHHRCHCRQSSWLVLARFATWSTSPLPHPRLATMGGSVFPPESARVPRPRPTSPQLLAARSAFCSAHNALKAPQTPLPPPSLKRSQPHPLVLQSAASRRRRRLPPLRLRQSRPSSRTSRSNSRTSRAAPRRTRLSASSSSTRPSCRMTGATGADL